MLTIGGGHPAVGPGAAVRESDCVSECASSSCSVSASTTWSPFAFGAFFNHSLSNGMTTRPSSVVYETSIGA